MFYLTGDTHSDVVCRIKTWIDLYYEDTYEDNYLIILGDFGLIWHSNPTEFELVQIELINKLCLETKLTLLFLDGNHENFERLEKFPIIEWNGGRVGKISPFIFHLQRGESYKVSEYAENWRFVVLGGADSHDKEWRVKPEAFLKYGKLWWPQERISDKDVDNTLEQLNEYDCKVILTHDCPSTIYSMIYAETPKQSNHQLQKVFDEVYNRGKNSYWFFGHQHLNQTWHLDNVKCTALYEEIIPLNL